MDVIHGVSWEEPPTSGESPVDSLMSVPTERRDTGTSPSGTRFKPAAQAGLSTASRSHLLHGPLGRRRPRQLLLHGSTSCIPAVVSAHGPRGGDTHIPA